MMSWAGLILLLIVAVFSLAIFWRADDVVEGEKADESAADASGDRIVSEVEAAQRLRREAEETADPQERARLIRFADEAEGTVEKIRRGVLSDR